MSAQLQFIRQQGFTDATAEEADRRFRALMWQPRAVLVLAFVGMLLETGWYWVGLGAVLWWGALLPPLNLFDAVYNVVFRRGDSPKVPPPPAPRRFEMALTGGLSIGIGIAELAGRIQVAWHILGIFFLALALVVFGRFSIGAYLFHLLTGRAAFANQTLPWSRQP